MMSWQRITELFRRKENAEPKRPQESKRKLSEKTWICDKCTPSHFVGIDNARSVQEADLAGLDPKRRLPSVVFVCSAGKVISHNVTEAEADLVKQDLLFHREGR